MSTNRPRTTQPKKNASAQQRQSKIRSLALAAAGILAVAAAVWVFYRGAPAQATPVVEAVQPARVGAALGDFSLTDVNGNTVRLSDYRGKPVLINTWATWCPPCKAEMPLLNQYYQKHAAEGFTLLAVNAGDSQASVAAFVKQNRLAFPVLLDPDTRTIDQMRISGLPTSIMIGKDGLVKKIHVGMFTPESIEAEITPHLD